MINTFFTETITKIPKEIEDKIWGKVRTSARFGAGGAKTRTKRNKERIEQGLPKYTPKEYQRLFGHELTIDKKYIQELWLMQMGRCAISNWGMNPEFNLIPNHSLQISVDRIDSSKGYIPGNCQLTLTCFNRMKNDCDGETWLGIKRKLGFV